MSPDAGQYLSTRLRKLRDEILGLADVGEQATSQSGDAGFEITDLIQQFVLSSLMVLDGSHRKSLSAFLATSRASRAVV